MLMQNYFHHPVHCRYVNKIEQAKYLRYREAVAGTEALGFVLGTACAVCYSGTCCM